MSDDEIQVGLDRAPLSGLRSRRQPRRCWSREFVVNRYYDPTTGQFLSVDPDVAQTGQPFGYANEDPVNNADPLGLCVAGQNEGCVGGVPHVPSTPAQAPCPNSNPESQWIGYNPFEPLTPTMPSYCYQGMGCVCPQRVQCNAIFGWEPVYGPPAPAPTSTPGSSSSGDGLSPAANDAIQGAGAGVGCIAGARAAAPVASALIESGVGAIAVDGGACVVGGIAGWFGFSLDP